MRPGFELGYKTAEGKYYIYNHLVFNILVSLTHGEYTAAREKYDNMAMDSLETRRLMTAGRGEVQQQKQEISGAASSSGVQIRPQKPLRKLSGDGAEAEGAGAEPFYMVVGFEVSPCSIMRDSGKPIEDIVCGGAEQAQEIVEGAQIVYSYDVYWQDSDIKWASRWDAYLRMPGGKVGVLMALCFDWYYTRGG